MTKPGVPCTVGCIVDPFSYFDTFLWPSIRMYKIPTPWGGTFVIRTASLAVGVKIASFTKPFAKQRV